MKIHYRTILNINYTSIQRSACGAKGERTSNLDLVTCLQCRATKVFKGKVAAPVHPVVLGHK
jgi:DNA-directed RNA polymerase subunit RPC12/RpoP